jgi:hypothetical protein
MDTETAFQLSQDLARRINREALADPSSPYAGKFVGVANGQVVVVADDWQTVHRRLEEIEPDYRRRCWFEASRDYSIPERV